MPKRPAATKHLPAPERLLLLRLARGRYALRTSDISGLAQPGTFRQVPAAPSGVLGLTEWHGRLLTVLDLPELVGDGPLETPASLIRLAPPHAQTALYVPGPVQLLAVEDGTGAPHATAEPYELLEPAVFVKRLEREILPAGARGARGAPES